MRRPRIPELARLAVAAVFAAQAGLRLAQYEFHVLRFAVLGWPPWTVWAVAAVELAGALLLLRPATVVAGAGVLAAVPAALLVTYLRLGVPEAAAAPLGLLLAVGGILLLERRRS